MPRKATCTYQTDLIARKYVEMRPAVLGYIMKRIGNAEEAKDICQEIFTRLLEYDALLTEYSLPNFIFRSARNLIVDYFRRHAQSEKARAYFALHSRKHACDTDQAVRFDEIREIESRCISELGEHKGRIYRMHTYQGLTSREISEALCLSRRTVENHIFAIRNRLRRELRQAL